MPSPAALPAVTHCLRLSPFLSRPPHDLSESECKAEEQVSSGYEAKEAVAFNKRCLETSTVLFVCFTPVTCKVLYF